MKKRIMTVALCLCLLAVAAMGTIAYFTDTDSDKNVFAFGNVEIDQFEMQRDENGKLVNFEDGNTVMPAAGDPAYAGVYVSYEDVDAPGNNEIWAEHMNADDKFVFVKNNGSEPAYYRTIIAIECPEGVELRTNVNNNERFDWDPNTAGQQGGNQEDVFVTVKGVRYAYSVATYTQVLEPKEVSRPSLLQVAFDKATTQEDVAKFGTDGVQVYAFTQAVQAEGFADKYTEDVACNALNDAFGEITDAKIGGWLEEVIG